MLMTAAMKTTNETSKEKRDQRIICFCCLTLFPAIYLIGSAIRTLLIQ